MTMNQEKVLTSPLYKEMEAIIAQQYKLGNTKYKSRQNLKQNQDNYQALQNSIVSSENSLLSHKRNIRTLARVLPSIGVSSLSELTEAKAANYLLIRQAGAPIWIKQLSAWTVSSDMLTINHLMHGSGFWMEPLTKAKANQLNKTIMQSGENLLLLLPGYSINREKGQIFVDFYREKDGKVQGFNTPKGQVYYEIDLTLQPRRIKERVKNTKTWKEWLEEHPRSAQNNEEAILLGRAFGFRRGELVGNPSSYYNREITTSTFGLLSDGRPCSLIIGKGGEFRVAPCRLDLVEEVKAIKLTNGQTMGELCASHPLNPIDSHSKKTLRDFLSESQKNGQKVLGDLLDRPAQAIPFQSLRRDYSHARLEEERLNHPHGPLQKVRGHLATESAWKAVSSSLGHNRVDVMASYFYTSGEE